LAAVIISAILTFVATELDDFAVYVVLFAKQKSSKLSIFLGQFTVLVLLSCLCAFLSIPLSRIPEQYLRFIGLVPIALGIWSVFDKDEEDEPKKTGTNAFLTSALITISASADNLGIYIPYFTDLEIQGKVIAIVIFAVLQCFWSLLQIKTADIPVVQNFISKTSRILVPVLFILLGLMILFF